MIETNNKENLLHLNNNNNQSKNINTGVSNNCLKPISSSRDKTSNNLFDKLLGNREPYILNGKKSDNYNFIVSPSSSREKFFSPKQNLKNSISSFKDICYSQRIINKTSNTHSNNLENKNYNQNVSKNQNDQVVNNNKSNKIYNNPKINEDKTLYCLNNKDINLFFLTKEYINSNKDKHNHRSQSDMIDTLHIRNNSNLDSIHKKSTMHNKNSVSTFQNPDNLKINSEIKNIQNNQNNLNINEVKKLINSNIKSNSKLNSKEFINNFHNLDFEKKNFRSMNFNGMFKDEAANKNINSIKKKEENHNLNKIADNSVKDNNHELKKHKEMENINVLFKKFSLINNSEKNNHGKEDKNNPEYITNLKNNRHLIINNNNNIVNNNFYINTDKIHLVGDRNNRE